MTQNFDWKTYTKTIVETDYPVATDSPDHLCPWGTARDNSTNPSFVRRLVKLFAYKEALRVLDLGCSGGGFVKSCIDDGCFAVGIEGSDFSARMHRANWPLLHNKQLFTADISKPFSIKVMHGRKIDPIQFDVITLWEVLEHIDEQSLSQLFTNIKNHLSEQSLVIVSVSSREEVVRGVPLHQTVKSFQWWEERFKKEGFTRLKDAEEVFKGHYIRGPQNPTEKESQNFVLSLSPDRIKVPEGMKPRKKSLLKRLISRRAHS